MRVDEEQIDGRLPLHRDVKRETANGLDKSPQTRVVHVLLEDLEPRSRIARSALVDKLAFLIGWRRAEWIDAKKTRVRLVPQPRREHEGTLAFPRTELNDARVVERCVIFREPEEFVRLNGLKPPLYTV